MTSRGSALATGLAWAPFMCVAHCVSASHPLAKQVLNALDAGCAWRRVGFRSCRVSEERLPEMQRPRMTAPKGVRDRRPPADQFPRTTVPGLPAAVSSDAHTHIRTHAHTRSATASTRSGSTSPAGPRIDSSTSSVTPVVSGLISATYASCSCAATGRRAAG